MAGPADTVNATAFTGDSSGHGFARARGNGAGVLGASASGGGTYSSTATFVQSFTIENDETFGQGLSFLFYIENGSIRANRGFSEEQGEVEVPGGGECTGDDFAEASYAANIKLNGTEILSSSATVRQDATESAFVHDPNTQLAPQPPADSNFYSWGADSFLLTSVPQKSPTNGRSSTPYL